MINFTAMQGVQPSNNVVVVDFFYKDNTRELMNSRKLLFLN